MVGGDERLWSGDDLIVIGPTELAFQDVERQVQANSIGAEEVCVTQSGILFPSLFELDGLESRAGPTLFEAFPNTLQTLIDSKTGHEQLNRH